MPGYDKEVFSNVLKTRYREEVSGNEQFDDLLKQLDKVPVRKDTK